MTNQGGGRDPLDGTIGVGADNGWAWETLTLGGVALVVALVWVVGALALRAARRARRVQRGREWDRIIELGVWPDPEWERLGRCRCVWCRPAEDNQGRNQP